MTETPWWYSGGSPEDEQAADADATDPAADEPMVEAPKLRLDLGSLASGAQQLVDLARQALLVPHSAHRNAADHPECVICRTMVAVGEVRTGVQAVRTPRTAGQVEWIELDPPVR